MIIYYIYPLRYVISGEDEIPVCNASVGVGGGHQPIKVRKIHGWRYNSIFTFAWLIQLT